MIYKGVYLFERQKNNNFKYYNQIIFESSILKHNTQLIIHDNSMFISTASKGYSFVIEI